MPVRDPRSLSPLLSPINTLVALQVYDMSIHFDVNATYDCLIHSSYVVKYDSIVCSKYEPKHILRWLDTVSFDKTYFKCKLLCYIISRRDAAIKKKRNKTVSGYQEVIRDGIQETEV